MVNWFLNFSLQKTIDKQFYFIMITKNENYDSQLMFYNTFTIWYDKQLTTKHDTYNIHTNPWGGGGLVCKASRPTHSQMHVA